LAWCCAMGEVADIRGIIRNRDRKQQIIDFSGLRYGLITPTDIDGVIEYKNSCFLFMEFKCSFGAKIPAGQRIALERLCDGLDRPAILIHAVHDAQIGQDINARNSFVYRYYWKGKWKAPDDVMSVGEAADRFFDKHAPGG